MPLFAASKILDEIVRSVGGETNLPIGNLTSQWLGNVYLNELDHFVKSELRWRDYIRYCDDFCLYGNDKNTLKHMAQKIKVFITDGLKLVFSRSIVRQTVFGVAFVGYRHFKNFILLKKYAARKIKHRIMNIINHSDISEHATGQIAAFWGWVRWSCSYNYCRGFIGKKGENKNLLPFFNWI